MYPEDVGFPMDHEEFRASVEEEEPPKGLSAPLALPGHTISTRDAIHLTGD